MANLIVPLNVYQINSKPGFGATTPASSIRIGMPTNGGFLINDTINSPTRSLSTGFNVYSNLQSPTGTLYYVQETSAEVIALFNA